MYKSGYNVIAKTEYEQLYDDPCDDQNNMSGASYTTYYSYDGDKEITTYPSGLIQEIREYNNEDKLVKSYTYDFVNGTQNNLEQYTYDSTSDEIATRTDARGGKTEYEYSSYGSGYAYLVDERMDPNNNVGLNPSNRRIKVAYTYDDVLRILTEEEFDCNAQGSDSKRLKKTSYNYDSSLGSSSWGLLISQVVEHEWQNSQYTQSETTTYMYDLLGQQTRIIRPDGVVTGTSYSQAGQLQSEFVLASVSDPNDADPNLLLLSQTWYTYDNDGRLEYLDKVRVDDPCFAFSDPNDNTIEWVRTKYEYDFMGRRSAVIEDTTGLSLKTTYEYDNQGELVKTMLPNGKWTKPERDGRGLVIKQIVGYGSGQNETEVSFIEFKYDANGNMVEKKEPYTDSDGNDKKVKTIYEYDNLDRLLRIRRGIVCDD